MGMLYASVTATTVLQVKDIKGRVFGLAVNAEHKATECSPKVACMLKEPHMWTFWSATIGFFCTFFSCFAPSALDGIDAGDALPRRARLLAEHAPGSLAAADRTCLRLAQQPADRRPVPGRLQCL